MLAVEVESSLMRQHTAAMRIDDMSIGIVPKCTIRPGSGRERNKRYEQGNQTLHDKLLLFPIVH